MICFLSCVFGCLLNLLMKVQTFLNERKMKMSCNKALCSSFLCFGFFGHCYGFIAICLRAPTFKWGISITNVVDFLKPLEKISYPQQLGMKRFHLKYVYFSFESNGSIRWQLISFQLLHSMINPCKKNMTIIL